MMTQKISQNFLLPVDVLGNNQRVRHQHEINKIRQTITTEKTTNTRYQKKKKRTPPSCNAGRGEESVIVVSTPSFQHNRPEDQRSKPVHQSPTLTNFKYPFPISRASRGRNKNDTSRQNERRKIVHHSLTSILGPFDEESSNCSLSLSSYEEGVATATAAAVAAATGAIHSPAPAQTRLTAMRRNSIFVPSRPHGDQERENEQLVTHDEFEKSVVPSNDRMKFSSDGECKARKTRIQALLKNQSRTNKKSTQIKQQQPPPSFLTGISTKKTKLADTTRAFHRSNKQRRKWVGVWILPTLREEERETEEEEPVPDEKRINSNYEDWSYFSKHYAIKPSFQTSAPTLLKGVQSSTSGRPRRRRERRFSVIKAYPTGSERLAY